MGQQISSSQAFKVLLAVDGSEHSYAAAAMVGDLPLPNESVVRVLGVVTPYYTPEREQIQSAVKQALAILTNRGIEADGDILYGNPPAELTKYAEQIKPDLIVVGAKGVHAAMGILLGGVAQQIVEYARCPTLVARAPYTPLRELLLLTDGSSYSERAAEYLARVPLPSDVRIHVMHVLAPLVNAVPSETWQAEATVSPSTLSETELAQHERAGQAIVERAVALLKPTQVEIIPVLAHGDAVEKIVEYASAHAIQLIVCGARGLGSLSGWLLGSVSRKLVHYFDCSVLVVKSDEPTAQQ